MTIGSIVSWAICGLLVGMVARLLVPGHQNMSLPLTAVLGVVGALLGGFLYSLLMGPAVTPFTLSSHNWYGWVIAILGATLVVWMYPRADPRKM